MFRSFGAKKQKASALRKKASQVFSGGSANSSGPASEESSPGLFNTLREKVEANTPFKVPLTPVRQPQNGHSAGMTASTLAPLRGKKEAKSPRSITDILSAVLLVLQLYEVNPVITVQIFSQIFFWIACEVFNRILTRKKYLCRSKAVQIRMNITALDDWVRLNGLPLQTASKHFEPLVQLLQWLQCQSALSDFDDLVSTMQNMKSINPLQMRRAIRDYRYEVNEGRMTDECGQYLAQLQNDWERRRLQASISAVKKEAQRRNDAPDADSSFDSETSFTEEPDQGTPIDALFDGTTALSEFVPPSAPDSLGELLDSRFMLPFNLPTETSFLVAVPPHDAAYVNMPSRGAGGLVGSDGNGGSRPPSRSSFSASRPMGWDLPPKGKIRPLPGDFFRWIRRVESDRRVDVPVYTNAKLEGAGSRMSKAIDPTGDVSYGGEDPFDAGRIPGVLQMPSTDTFVKSKILPADSFYTPPSPTQSLQLHQDESPSSSPDLQAHDPQDRLETLSHSTLRKPADVASSPTTPQHTSPRSDGSPTASKRRWWNIGGRASSEDSTSDVSDILR